MSPFYFIGGIGVNYQQAGDMRLAPMRAGLGLRAGANVRYLAYTRQLGPSIGKRARYDDYFWRALRMA